MRHNGALHFGAAAFMILHLSFTNCSPSSGQYHIQTDEGPERYFRFQTDNGQFRKERRLHDGTVIGTEAWIDAAGFLRQKDYIADKSGYRILKSKTVFVGQSHIEDAIKSTKAAAVQSNAIEDHIGYVYSTTPTPSFSTTSSAPTKLSYLSPAEAAKIQPSPYLGFDHYPDELQSSRTLSHKKPLVHIRHHSEPVDLQRNSITDEPYFYKIVHTTPVPSEAVVGAVPSLDMEPPYESRYRRVKVPAPLPAPIAADEVSPTSIVPHQRKSYYTTSSPLNQELRSYQSTTGRLAFDVNNMAGLLPPPPPTYHRNWQRAQEVLPADNGGANARGFGYILPRQYHEEAQIGEHKRAGSFGYVDPFGIRRVVYYNASPERGFVHRNNNQFVGLDAPPYDPPPAVPFVT